MEKRPFVEKRKKYIRHPGYGEPGFNTKIKGGNSKVSKQKQKRRR